MALTLIIVPGGKRRKVCMETIETIKTPRGTFKVRAEFKTNEEANEAGYYIYFTNDDGTDIYTKHLDEYHVHVGIIRKNRNLIGTENVGYKIIQQGVTAVIGYSSRKDEYVAWSYGIRNGEASYFWGRYGSQEYAEKAYELKERGEYSGDI